MMELYFDGDDLITGAMCFLGGLAVGILTGLNNEYDDLEYKMQATRESLQKLNWEVERQNCYLNKLFFPIKQLSSQEQYLFLTLYSSKDALSYPQIAERMRLTESLVRQNIANLIRKGVAVTKHYMQGKAFLSLDSEFKELQAKEVWCLWTQH